MPNFHSYRYTSKHFTPYLRLWHWHDRHPLPPRLNKVAREALYWCRRLRQRLSTPRPRDGWDEYGDPVASRYSYPEPVRPFAPIPLAAVEARFREIHAANEHLYNGNGSWEPHPRMPLCGSGIPVEEVSERVLGYIGAYEAFGDPLFLQRAEEGGRYLLDRRVFANGHLRLEGHLVIELEYAYAGCALLALWEHDRTRTEYLDAALKIGARLLEEHIGGAIDHALKPVQLLAPLYRITGDERYLRASLRRSFRAVRLQLPYGGWPGDDSRIWYHCIIARGLIDAYVATPNTLEHYVKRDHLARAITAALNRVAHAQVEDGHVRIGRGDGTKDPLFAKFTRVFHRRTVVFTASGFEQGHLDLCDFAPRDVMDLLTSAWEDLSIAPAARMAHGFAGVALRTSQIHRLDFETYAVGRYALFLRRLARLNPEAQRRTGGLVALTSPKHTQEASLSTQPLHSYPLAG
jgi:hypothetical protein